MNFIISGKNIDVTPGLKDAIEQKLGKLERYFTPETEIMHLKNIPGRLRMSSKRT